MKAKDVPEPIKPGMQCIGTSYDGRTNRWRMRCMCGKEFEPPTTRLARNTVSCPRCSTTFNVNYNEMTIAKAPGEAS